MGLLRILFNAILYALLFYFIWYFFPDAFQTLSEWVSKLANWLIDIGHRLMDWIKDATHTQGVPHDRPEKLFLIPFLGLMKK